MPARLNGGQAPSAPTRAPKRTVLPLKHIHMGQTPSQHPMAPARADCAVRQVLEAMPAFYPDHVQHTAAHAYGGADAGGAAGLNLS